MNARKGREAWRPLAPIVREDDTTWFHDLTPSPHMILTFRATAAAHTQVPGIVHEDGTARVQTVGPGDDAFVRALLDALAAAGGPDVLLNTSLNRPGERSPTPRPKRCPPRPPWAWTPSCSTIG